MTLYFLDVEANGFLEDATKVHCLCVKPQGSEDIRVFDDTDLSRTRYGNGNIMHFMEMMEPHDTLVWHNGFGYDVPLLELFGVPSRCDIDTLALSREWWPDCPRGHGLDAWGKHLGVIKPKVDDWDNQPLEVYIERCSMDVRITEGVYDYLLDKMGIEL
jgi:uncharacterized protein YprB with RNaseH-like and TPR domain